MKPTEIVKTIAVYIFDKKTSKLIVLPEIDVTHKALEDIHDYEVRSLLVSASISDRNKDIYLKTGKSVLWLPIDAGDVVATDISIQWLEERNDNLAVQNFMKYYYKKISELTKQYEQAFSKLSESVTILSKKLNDLNTCYKLYLDTAIDAENS